jgi:hypothetical protein
MVVSEVMWDPQSSPWVQLSTSHDLGTPQRIQCEFLQVPVPAPQKLLFTISQARMLGGAMLSIIGIASHKKIETCCAIFFKLGVAYMLLSLNYFLQS